jgi:hypothetical protein
MLKLYFAIAITKILEALDQRAKKRRFTIRVGGMPEHCNPWDAILTLRVCKDRPSGRPAYHGDEVAPFHVAPEARTAALCQAKLAHFSGRDLRSGDNPRVTDVRFGSEAAFPAPRPNGGYGPKAVIRSPRRREI